MPLSDSLVSYWKLEDTADSHGANTLTNNGTTTFTAGKLNNAATFDGVTQYLSRANKIVTSGSYSVSLWVKPTNVLTPDSYFLHQADGDGETEFSLRILDDTGIKIVVTALAYDLTIVSGPSSTWYHAVITAAANSQQGYLNGSQVATASGASLYTANGSGKLTLGGRQDGAKLLLGQVDEVAIANRVWSAAEVALIYNGGTPLAYEDWATTSAPTGKPTHTMNSSRRRRAS